MLTLKKLQYLIELTQLNPTIKSGIRKNGESRTRRGFIRVI